MMRAPPSPAKYGDIRRRRERTSLAAPRDPYPRPERWDGDDSPRRAGQTLEARHAIASAGSPDDPASGAGPGTRRVQQFQFILGISHRLYGRAQLADRQRLTSPARGFRSLVLGKTAAGPWCRRLAGLI